MPTVLDIQVVCTSDTDPTADQFQLWADTALSHLNKDFELTIRVVDNSESQQLNHQYRNKNKPTNVLSFPFEVPEGIELNLLGDLVICSDIVASEALQQNKAITDHWAHLVIHGCLHLLGYDHIEEAEAEEMESLEIQLLASLGIDNPYQAG